jgi:hypothetical protein
LSDYIEEKQMRHLRNLLLLAMAALVAMAFAAATAAAEHEAPEGDLNIKNEVGPVNCTDAVPNGTTGLTGGCLIHATSEGNVIFKEHIFGIESTFSTCTHEFHGRIGANGEGYLTEHMLAGGSCPYKACKDATGEAERWHVVAHENFPVPGDPEGTKTNREFLSIELCVQADMGVPETCDIRIGFSQIRTESHLYELGHVGNLEMPGTSGAPGFRCEIQGHWNTEIGGTHDGQPENELKITHL